MIRLLASVLAAGFIAGGVQASEMAGGLPRVFCADAQTLAANKSALAAGDTSLRPALSGLLAEADKKLGQKPASVMDKVHLPPSGDKHDYISQAPYFWRDTNAPGIKYVNRDGRRNPEAETNSDAGNFAAVCYDSHTLALAYYFTGNEKYAAKAGEFIRVWFLNPATRMNPNFKYGQGIPGSVEGRAAGLISARGLADLMDAIGLLAGSKNWTTNDQQGMTAWVTDYLQWLTTSEIGRGEDAALNNHGTYYDVQAVSLALFLGRTDYAREKLLAAREARIARQIDPDGKMPRELARTLSFHYTLFNLDAELQLAALGRCAGVDLWHYQTADGRSILRAAEFMAPFADAGRAWTYQQIQKPNRDELGRLLLRVAAEFPGGAIGEALKIFRPGDFAGDSERLYLKLGTLPSPG
ncbi:MAG TPA: alginate lyase family protein [Candidatus Acidoferrales bacterium]|nr:alginate lyase family protein [Candidatus Acidoferrales bacterium]